MKKTTLTIIFFLIANSIVAQSKYYLIKFQGETSNWRDTLFVVKVSNPTTQSSFSEELALPFNSRTKIVNGQLQSGSDDYNKNGTHCFNWHMIDETIELADITNETCDGRPYSDAELANFVTNPGWYCPWGMRVFEEISFPPSCSLSLKDDLEIENKVQLYPNPSRDMVHINYNNITFSNYKIAIFDLNGKLVFFEYSKEPIYTINIGSFESGLYDIVFKLDKNKFSKKLCKE